MRSLRSPKQKVGSPPPPLQTRGIHRPARFAAAWILAVGGWFALAPPMAQAQVQSIPSGRYFIARQTYDDGDFVRAFKDMRQVIAGNALGRSSLEMLCYHALAGECLYQMGDLPGAMEQYTAALRSWQASANFMTRCTFPAEQLMPDNSVVRPPLPGRAAAAAAFASACLDISLLPWAGWLSLSRARTDRRA